jgi:hypothetical protein
VHSVGNGEPQLLHFGVDAFGDLQRVVPAEHLHHEIDDLSATVGGRRADARDGALPHLRHVGNANGGALVVGVRVYGRAIL